MTRRPSSVRLGRLLGLVAAVVVLGGGAALAASIGLTSQKITLFTAPGPPAATDTRAPQLVTLQMFDTGTPDGFIDTVVATFDETLAAYTAPTSIWTPGSSPSGRVISNVAVTTGGTTATLTLSGGNTTKDTAGSGFTVALASSSAGIRDAAGNQSSFSAAAVADKASPLPISLALEDGPSPGDNNGGLPGKGDRVRVRFSEKLSVSSICSTWLTDAAQTINAAGVITATIKDVSTNADSVTVASSAAACGGDLRFGTIALTSGTYSSGTVTFGGSDPSSIVWTPGIAELLVTFGAVTGTPGDENSSSIAATYTPNSSVKDVAGNAIAGSVTSTRRHF